MNAALPASTPTPVEDVGRWRCEVRQEFRNRRLALRSPGREEANAAICERLLDAFGLLQGMAVGFYAPMRGEVDPGLAMRRLWERGTIAALPVMAKRHAPLEFREWTPEVRMAVAAFGVREPVGSALVVPQALLIPPVAFDKRGYRLGYGGGYYDRTLAAMRPQPLKIALAFEVSRIETIHPQPHDIPMDFVVTETAIYRVGSDGLETVECAEVARFAHQLLRERIAGRGEPSLDSLRDTARQYASPPCYAHEIDPYYWDI